MTESDRQLLAPLATLSEPYMFGRAGGAPHDLAELDAIAARLLELEREGIVEIVGAPMMDYTRPGGHYYAIHARLTAHGRAALKTPMK